MAETVEPKYQFAKKYRKQILQCSRCGYCQASCPVFEATKRPALNARGKMLLLKEIMDGDLDFSEEMIETFAQCSTCAACHENCPSGVDVPKIIKEARKDMVHIGSCHPAFTSMNEVLLKNDNIYMEDELPDFDKDRDRVGAEVIYYVGCVGNYREDENTEATLELFDRLKLDYTMVTEVCCSGVLNDVGYQLNPELARKNVEQMLSIGAKMIICSCPYCYKTFTHAEEYKELNEKMEIIHLSQFLAKQDFSHLATDDKVTYHDSCDLGRHCNIYDEPRKTITEFADDFVELPNNRNKSRCCGAGGGMRGAYGTNSVAMAKNRMQEILGTEADVVLTSCNQCVNNLSNAKKRKDKIRIVNMAEYLNELLEDAE
jgi:Fe-S oxidoreductase